MTGDAERTRSGRTPAEPAPDRRGLLLGGGLATFAALLGGGSLGGSASPALADGDDAGSLRPTDPLDITIAVYSKGTLLDFAGPCEIFRRLPNTTVRIASLHGGPVSLEFGVDYGKTERLADVVRTDLLLVPGGPDLSEPTSPDYLAEIRRIAEQATYITSVCTGSLVLGAAGLLKGRRSACHWAFLNDLTAYGAIPDPARFVEDGGGRFMSGGGVTSGIDFALRVAAKLRGRLAAEFAQLIIEYDPDPPFRSGHPRVAPPEVLAMVEARVPGAIEGRRKIPGVL